MLHVNPIVISTPKGFIINISDYVCKKERKTNKDYTAEKKLIRRELSKSLHRYQEKLEESLLKPSNLKSFYKCLMQDEETQSCPKYLDI